MFTCNTQSKQAGGEGGMKGGNGGGGVDKMKILSAQNIKITI